MARDTMTCHIRPVNGMDGQRRRPPGASSRASRAAVVVVVLLAFWLRLWRLDSVPPGLHFDEAVYGLMARDILGGARPVFFSAYTGREPLYMYLMAAVFSLAGSTAWTLRLTSALAGTVTVASVYVLGRALYGRWVALAAAALLTTSYWHLTVSRNGYPNVLIPPLEALSAYLLWRGWRGGRRLDWAAAGALSSLVLYTYLAARFWPVLLATVLIWALALHGQTVRRHAGGIAVFALAAGIVILPLGVHFARHPADFSQRANQVLAWQQLSGRALAGALASSAWQTARGVVGRGDPRWHFNLPGRAMLQPWAAAFFLVGLALCLRRWKDLRYALPLLWLAVMALPGILTLEMQPAGQRVFGVVPALVLVTGVGLVATARWLATQTGRRAARASTIATAIALVALLDGAVTARDYFVTWAQSPEVAAAFHADYVRMAEVARQDLAEGQTVVLLSEHYKHPTVAFLAPELVDGAVWADPRLALPVPVARDVPRTTARASPEPAVCFYRLTASLPDGAPAAQELDRAGAGVQRWRVAPPFLGEDGQTVLDVVRYQVSMPARLIQGESDAAGTQAPAPAATLGGEVTAWRTPAAIDTPRGRAVTVPVDWRAERAVAQARSFSLRLRDGAGVDWAQADQTGFLSEQWRPGDRVRQWFSLPLEATMPPGEYQAYLLLLDAAGQPMPVAGMGAGAWPVATVRVSADGRRRAAADSPVLARIGDLALLGRMTDGQVTPGSWITVDPLWARWGPAPPARLELDLLSADGSLRSLGRVAPSADGYPPTAWRERELARARHRFRVPADTAPGTYTVVAVAVGGEPAESQAALGTVTVAVGQRMYQAPHVEHAVQATFGPLALLGYDLAPAAPAPGGELTLDLVWQERAPGPDGTVFVHLYGSQGDLVAQHDGVPADGTRPIPGWLPGEVVVDRHPLTVPAALAPGTRLMLAVGLYDPATGERWPARAADGQQPADSALRLTQVVVGPK